MQAETEQDRNPWQNPGLRSGRHQPGATVQPLWVRPTDEGASLSMALPPSKGLRPVLLACGNSWTVVQPALSSCHHRMSVRTGRMPEPFEHLRPHLSSSFGCPICKRSTVREIQEDIPVPRELQPIILKGLVNPSSDQCFAAHRLVSKVPASRGG